MSKSTTQDQVRAEVRQKLGNPSEVPSPNFDVDKAMKRVALIVGATWIVAGGMTAWRGGYAWIIVAALITAIVVGASWWAKRMLGKQRTLAAIMQGAETREDREAAAERIRAEFKEGDAMGAMARAQLEMQDNPRKALSTLEGVNLDKEMAAVASQVRAMRAMIHLNLGEITEAKALVNALDLGKQQDAKLRAMMATVASETWARSGEPQKAVDTLDLFNPDDASFSDMAPQMWRARAFAYAGISDTKNMNRALGKLEALSPHLLGMFVGQKRVHPLLEREAKQRVMRAGLVRPQRQQMRYR